MVPSDPNAFHWAISAWLKSPIRIVLTFLYRELTSKIVKFWGIQHLDGAFEFRPSQMNYWLLPINFCIACCQHTKNRFIYYTILYTFAMMRMQIKSPQQVVIVNVHTSCGKIGVQPPIIGIFYKMVRKTYLLCCMVVWCKKILNLNAHNWHSLLLLTF